MSQDDITKKLRRAAKARFRLPSPRMLIDAADEIDYARKSVEVWRNNALDNAAEIVEKYFGEDGKHCATDIRRMIRTQPKEFTAPGGSGLHHSEMTIEDAKKHIAALSDKAAKAEKSEDALRLSQAACNVANALCALGSAHEAK